MKQKVLHITFITDPGDPHSPLAVCMADSDTAALVDPGASYPGACLGRLSLALRKQLGPLKLAIPPPLHQRRPQNPQMLPPRSGSHVLLPPCASMSRTHSVQAPRSTVLEVLYPSGWDYLRE